MRQRLNTHDRALLAQAVADLRAAAEAMGAAHEIADELVGYALHLRHEDHGKEFDAAVTEWGTAYDELRSGYNRMVECIRPHLM